MVLDCTSDATHLSLWQYLLRKHEAAYREHVWDVLAWEDEAIGELRRQNVALELAIATEQRPALAARQREFDRLAAALKAVSDLPSSDATELAASRRELDRLRAEVQALRASLSWRVTAPLRQCYDLLTRKKGGPT
jgi:hypothetical protein